MGMGSKMPARTRPALYHRPSDCCHSEPQRRISLHRWRDPSPRLRVTDYHGYRDRLPWMLVLCGVMLALLVACGGPVEYKRVRLSDGDPEVARAAVTPGKMPLRVAVAAVISPKETLKSYDALLDYMGKRLGRPGELVQRQTYAETNDLVRSAHLDVAFVSRG